ncbi:hypothetical protein SERLA73DRAFT_190632 [Serpula lacrymans var. lacrymans S7.3]|uniref:Uncharacterized protein n=2 Tax=Serpula lacrymans var. lacrymans TaxID=341189 RepID=F8QG28_SERL3|nr:uncharacterized protein SERLADRAFT_463506 [Serpula lacrymans var. lacrymans S7.9]EGN92776.1 hypothetical protein SERLA73DRAFT_190632 [Serpula lacrymans var. lacrymans S7.3]EGO26437.1 hypothetical protein SERLADRAFT_463506 [Serpula lacrymans var. lacrymans S7.9]
MPTSLSDLRFSLLSCSCILGLLVSISLPHLSAMDMVRLYWVPSEGGHQITQLRFGVWAFCLEVPPSARSCSGAGPAYPLYMPMLGASISSSWTRGLVAQPIAMIFTILALSLSSSHRLSARFLTAILATFFTILSFAAQIALLIKVKTELGKLNNNLFRESTKPGAGFWLSSISMVMLSIATCLTFFDERECNISEKPRYLPLSDPEN